MAKRYDEPIEVMTDESGWAGADSPLAFTWRGRRYFVDERLSSWCEAGQWWDRASVREREYYRVVAHPAGSHHGEIDADGFLITQSSVYDVYKDRLRDTWHMGRVWD